MFKVSWQGVVTAIIMLVISLGITALVGSVGGSSAQCPWVNPGLPWKGPCVPTPTPTPEKPFLPGVYVKEGTGFKTGYDWELHEFWFGQREQGFGLYSSGSYSNDQVFGAFGFNNEPYFQTDGIRTFKGVRYLRVLPENRPVYADDPAAELPVPTQITVRVDMGLLRQRLGAYAGCINEVGLWANYDYTGKIDADGGEVVVNLPRQGPYRYEIGVDAIHSASATRAVHTVMSWQFIVWTLGLLRAQLWTSTISR